MSALCRWAASLSRSGLVSSTTRCSGFSAEASSGCTLGSEEKIINEIANLPDVKEVRGTYGVHDVFVKVKSDNTESMNHTVTNRIRKIPGITSTVTLVVIEEQGGKTEGKDDNNSNE